MLKKIGLIILGLLILISIVLFLSNNWKSVSLHNGFKTHVSNNDSILFNGDFLHPRYAYFKNGSIVGLEIYDNPECGNYRERFYLKNYKIEKITIHKDYYSTHCEEIFDSIYVIDLMERNITSYVDFKLGKKIYKDELFASGTINFNECIRDIKNWNLN